MTDAPKAPAAEKGTKYAILRESKADPPEWIFLGYAIGPAGLALKASAKANGQGTYVAVPLRSWKPVKVTVSTETVVKLGGA